MKIKVDKMFINGEIHTLVNEKDICSGVCVKDGKIVFAGNSDEILSKYDSDEIIDLDGKVMLPGMGDSHLHFFAYCQTFTTVNLSEAKSKTEMLKLLKAKADETPEGGWIRGSNFDQSKWEDSSDVLPTREDLDKVSTKHPIVIKRVCLHTGVANTAALEKANITKDYNFGEGGVVELDKDGFPTGILREQATKIFDDIVPDETKIPEVRDRFMRKALGQATSLGLTTIHTYAAEIWKYIEDYDNYLRFSHNGELPLRVTIYNDKLYNKPFVTKKEMDNPYRLVQYGGYKIFCDGSLGSRSAKLYEPYADDPSTSGILIQTQDELNQKVLTGYRNELQPAIHCIGDEALDCVLTAIENALKVTREEGMTLEEQSNKLPFRIIHAQMANESLIQRMKQLPVILDIQPTFLMTDLHWIEDRVGKERADKSYNWQTYLDNGLMLLGGSDSPVESFSPWIGIYAAVTRKDINQYPPSGYNPKEKVSVYDAVCMYSKNIHYATGQEDYLGTIEAGKFADLVVIDRNIFNIPEDDLLEVKVLKTYLAGKEVFSA